MSKKICGVYSSDEAAGWSFPNSASCDGAATKYDGARSEGKAVAGFKEIIKVDLVGRMIGSCSWLLIYTKDRIMMIDLDYANAIREVP